MNPLFKDWYRRLSPEQAYKLGILTNLELKAWKEAKKNIKKIKCPECGEPYFWRSDKPKITAFLRFDSHLTFHKTYGRRLNLIKNEALIRIFREQGLDLRKFGLEHLLEPKKQ